MFTDELLTELEPLAHGERCRRLAEIPARLSPAELDGLLNDLGRRGHYERSLALTIASVARGEDVSRIHIRRALRDPDAGVAARAIGLAARLGMEAAAFQDLLQDAPAAVRARTYKAIRRHRRQDLAEALIEQVTARWGDAEGAALLPACGDLVAAERLAELAHAMPNWRSFGRAHPHLMLDHAERRLAELPAGARTAWWWTHAPGVAATVPSAPTRVVGLLERYRLDGPMPSAFLPCLGVLMDAEPARVPALLLAPESRRHLAGWFGPLRRRSVRVRLSRFGDDDLIAVARAVREDDAALCLLLKALPPSRRDRLFTSAMSGIDLTARELDGALLEALPSARRAQEAARMLRLRRVAETPALRWEMTSYLPFDQALPVLGAVARRPVAGDRATGYRLLVACAGRSRDPDVLSRLLESVGRLRNEQDPVRYSAIAAFAAMPPGLIESVHVPAFAQFVDDALAARDCSHQTRYQLVRLATRVFEQGAVLDDRDLMVFALEVFAKLTGHMGTINLGRLDRILRRGQEHDLVGRLTEQLEAEAARDEHRLAFTLADALGRRGWQVPALRNALEQALDSVSDNDVRQAIGHLLAAPRTRAERVSLIVSKDPSTVVLDTVFAAIARERTDLLHLALGRRPPAGRFRRPGVVYVPIAEASWTRRWTAAQRSAYLKLLHRLARDAGTPDSRRAEALGIIGRMPGVTAAELRHYLESSDTYLRRAALTAAARTSSPQDVLADLLRLAPSDDAHVAVYAAARAARFTVPSALGAVLTPVLADGKITARKEALRLLIRNRAPGAMDVLASAWDDPRQHHDVKVAIVSAARQCLAEPEALRILTEASAGPGQLARQVLGTRPFDIEPRWRATYAELVLRVVRSAEIEARNLALPRVPEWVPWAADATAALADIAADPADPASTESWRSALDSLVTCAVGGFGVDDLRSLTARLAAAPRLPEAEPDRDLPGVQRLRAVAMAVTAAVRAHPEGVGSVLDAVTTELPEPLSAEVVAATIRWDAPGAGDIIDDLAGRPIGPVLAIDRVARALAGPLEEEPVAMATIGIPMGSRTARSGEVEPEAVLPHARRLEARAELTAGILATALVARHGPRAGWAREWRDLLRRLRRHPHAEVAYAASVIVTSPE